MPVPLPTTRAFFYEVVIPGILAAILSYPFLPAWARPESGSFALLAFLGGSVLIGILPRLLSIKLVFFWLGVSWIPFIRARAVRNLQRKVTRATAIMARTNVDLWSRLTAEGFLRSFVEIEGTRIALLPTILGNGVMAFVVRLYRLTVGHVPRPEQLTGEDVARFVMRAYFSLPEDTKNEIGEGIGLGSGLINLSLICPVVAAIYVFEILLGSIDVGRGIGLALISIVVARLSHLLGRDQLLYSLGVIEAILEDQIGHSR